MVKCLLVVHNKFIVSIVGLGEWQKNKMKTKIQRQKKKDEDKSYNIINCHTNLLK